MHPYFNRKKNQLLLGNSLTVYSVQRFWLGASCTSLNISRNANYKHVYMRLFTFKIALIQIPCCIFRKYFRILNFPCKTIIWELLFSYRILIFLPVRRDTLKTKEVLYPLNNGEKCHLCIGIIIRQSVHLNSAGQQVV